MAAKKDTKDKKNTHNPSIIIKMAIILVII